MKTYEILYEPVIVKGVEYPKYNIYYYIGDTLYIKEFFNTTGIVDPENIRYGFEPKIK